LRTNPDEGSQKLSLDGFVASLPRHDGGVRLFKRARALSGAWDADLSHSGRGGFGPSAHRRGDATGSPRSKPFLKDLDFQIYSKHFQAFPETLFRIYNKHQIVKRIKLEAAFFLKPRFGML
jgi:hypothetical protein